MRTLTQIPTAILNEIHDSLVLALDASERLSYSQSEREPRRYMRSALRDTCALLGEVQA